VPPAVSLQDPATHVADWVAVLLAVPVLEPVSEEEPVCELDWVEDAV